MKTVYAGGEGEIVEKKSRFIATVRPVSSEEEAVAFINEMKRNTGMPDIIVMLILLENIGSLQGAAMTGSRQELQDGLCWM